MTATPKPKLAHLGLFTRDIAPMLDFYTGPMGLKPGDEFEIKLGKKSIRLIPVGASEEEE